MAELRNISIDVILRNPEILRNRALKEVQDILGTVRESWRVERLRKGASQGKGWVLREYTRNGRETGRMIRYHPGGGHHGPGPYWRAISFNVKSPIIPAKPPLEGG